VPFFGKSFRMGNKKEMARSLYFAGYKQQEIAKCLNMSEKTISLWAQEGDWRAKKSEEILWQDTNFERVQKLVAHNLRILTAQIEDPEQANTLVDKGHFDALSKALAAIRRQELKWSDEAKVIRNFVKWLADSDMAARTQAAIQIEEHATVWLLERRKMYE
jgi:predicted transcriptional regulator